MPSTLSSGKLRFVRHRTQFPHPKDYLSLDLGQRHDHSAFAALELTWTPCGRCAVTYEHLFTPTLHIRSLKRFPLGTSYEKIYNLVDGHLRQLNPSVNRELIIDAGGPGPPIVDRLRQNLPSEVRLRPVIITAGKGANVLSGGYTGVPRRTLVSTLQLLLAANSLKCEPQVDGVDLFRQELLELSGHNSQPVSRTAHDDVAIATALAAWTAVGQTPQLLPEPGGKHTPDSPRDPNDLPIWW